MTGMGRNDWVWLGVWTRFLALLDNANDQHMMSASLRVLERKL